MRVSTGHSRGSTTRPGRGSPAPLASSLHGVNLRPPAASRCSARKLAPPSFPRRPPAYVLTALVRRVVHVVQPVASPCATGAHESSHARPPPAATSVATASGRDIGKADHVRVRELRHPPERS